MRGIAKRLALLPKHVFCMGLYRWCCEAIASEWNLMLDAAKTQPIAWDVMVDVAEPTHFAWDFTHGAAKSRHFAWDYMLGAAKGQHLAWDL